MNQLEKRMVLISTLFAAASILSSSFMNVYLYAYTGSLIMMCLYTAIRIVLFPPFFILGRKLTSRYPFSLTICTGLIFIAASLAFALFGSTFIEQDPRYCFVSAFLTGIGEGFYWYSIASLQQIISTPASRPSFLSWMGALNNVANLLFPILASFIISLSSSEIAGYRSILMVVLVLYVIIFAMSFLMKVTSSEPNTSSMAAIFSKERKWQKTCFAVFVYGLRNSLTLALTSVLVYNAAGDGGLYSRLLVLFSLTAIISFRLLSAALGPQKLRKTFIFGAFLASSSTLALAYFPNIYGAIYFGIANALQGVFFETTYNYFTMNIMSEYDDQRGRVVARETYLSVGRVAGMLLICLLYLIMPDYYLIVSVTVLSLSPLLDAYLFNHIEA